MSSFRIPVGPTNMLKEQYPLDIVPNTTSISNHNVEFVKISVVRDVCFGTHMLAMKA